MMTTAKGVQFMSVIATAWFAIAAVAAAQESHARRAFEPFTAHWKGTFKVYSHEGRLLDQLEVEQRYWWQGNEQHATFVEKYRDGRVVRAEARNYVQDGQLYCAVEKDNGEKSLHHGRWEDGALFWYRKTEDGAITECFKERVMVGTGGREYHIDGFGLYGAGKEASGLLFEGRYYEMK